MRVLGHIPGPILYGYLLDLACLARGTSCTGEEGSCNIYDISIMSKNLVIATASLKVCMF